MPAKKETEPKTRTRRPSTTPEGREGQMVALAVDLAEQQLLDGTATSQVISHYLKLGSTRETLEQERLARENRLLQAKVEQIESGQRIEELYGEALSAMRENAGELNVSSDD